MPLLKMIHYIFGLFYITHYVLNEGIIENFLLLGILID